MKRFAIYLLAAICLAACTSTPESGSSSTENKEETNTNSTLFLSQTEIGIVSGSKMVKEFNKQSEQIIFDKNKSIYVVSNIDYTAQYTITIEGGIYLDNSLTVKLEATGLSGVENVEASVKVVKVDSSDQRYWLWNNDLEVGFILDFSI